MSQTTFWNLLKENKIEIPIIQRDYAQGREGKEYLRQTFLESLKNALDESLKSDENQDESSGKNKVLKLDFVYGSAENGALQPLDGQQRLTTLWLLHWYIAMRAGKLYEAGDTLKKFTYETRISSREFCEELCKEFHFKDYNLCKYHIECKPSEKCPRKSIVDYITSQTWFYSSWKQDPTIQSMLRMLGGTQIKGKSGNDIPDGIEEVFGESSDFEKYWDKLESDNAPIVFYYLPLKDFGLSDDLYIKMNARGKQLTNFENFKADLVGYIKKKANEDKIWEKFLQGKDGIPIKLDTEWTDVFWQNKTDDGRIDEIYFAFLNRYFLHYAIANLDANENSPIWKLYGDKSDDSALSYDNGFQMYADTIEKKLQVETSQEQNTSEKNLLEKLSALYANVKQIVDKVVKDEPVNNIQSINDKIRSYLPAWFALFDFIPQYKKDKEKYEVIKDSFGNNLYKVTTLNQSQRVVFFGICRYLEECRSFDEVQFKRWMRVVCNLTENTLVTMHSRIKLINELSSHCTDIYSFLSKLSDNESKIASDVEKSDLFRFLSEIKSDATKDQLSEEIEKARQILTGNYNGNIADLKGKTWEDVIIKAEKFAFFKGAIRFLFRNEKGEWDWKDFDTKWGNAQRYFKKECQKDDKSAVNEEWDNAGLLQKLIKNLFSVEYINGDENKIGKIFSWWWNKRLFNNNVATWSFYLLENYICKPIHDLLCDKNNISVIKEVNHNDYKKYEKTIYYLTQTNLLDYVIKKISFSWIRSYYNHHAIFPSSTGVFLDAENRNKILLTMDETKTISINEEHKIPDNKELLFGTNITFQYCKKNNSYNFRWDSDDYIYLLKDGNPVKDLTIDGESITDKDSLIQELNSCIEKYEKLQPEQLTS